jgi:hypothetical protein
MDDAFAIDLFGDFEKKNYLRIVKSTTPLLIANMYPLPNVAIGRADVVLSAEFANANYLSDSERLTINSIEQIVIDGQDHSPMVYAVGSPVGPATVFTEHWDAKSPSIPAGAYQFKITVRDWAGNEFTAYPDFIKDGVPPVINSPRAGERRGGVVVIRGVAQDPDLSNGDPFARYSLYYKAGDQSGALKDKNPVQVNLSGWIGAKKTIGEPGAIRVPDENREGSDPINLSRRPVTGRDGILGWWSTPGLANGAYTLLLIGEEQSGAGALTYQVVEVYNDGATKKKTGGGVLGRPKVIESATGKESYDIYVDYRKKPSKGKSK